MVTPAGCPDGEPAFRLLNVVRRFASEQLANPDETMGHLEGHLLDVLDKAGAGHGSQGRARRLLDSEQPNLQVVLGWMAGHQRPPGPLLQRLGNLWAWLLVRGHLRRTAELRQRIESWTAAELPSRSDQMALDWLLAQGLLADGSYAQAGVLLDEILPDARRLESPSRWGLMLMARAVTRPYVPASPALAELEEALAVARNASDLVVLGYVLSHFGLFLCVDGDATRARALHKEMLELARSLADDNQRAEAHYDLAVDALAAGDPGSRPTRTWPPRHATTPTSTTATAWPAAWAHSARSPRNAGTAAWPPGSSEQLPPRATSGCRHGRRWPRTNGGSPSGSGRHSRTRSSQRRSPRAGPRAQKVHSLLLNRNSRGASWLPATPVPQTRNRRHRSRTDDLYQGPSAHTDPGTRK